MKPEIDLLNKQLASSYMQKVYLDGMSSSLADSDHLNESLFVPLPNVYLGLNATSTFYDLKKKSKEYLQSTFVFSKERAETENMARVEALPRGR